MTDLYVPSDIQLGGQRTSASQLRTWTTCKQEWFLSYLAPHPDVPNSAGLRVAITADPLLAGSYFHVGMAAYLTSGWKDGEDTGARDAEPALAAVDESARQRKGEAETPEQDEENVTMAKGILLKYDEKLDEYVQHRVAADATGEPVVERSFEIPIGDGEFVYVDKIDAMLITPEGYHMVGEWKTTSYRFANQALAGLHMQGQTYGHMGVLTEAFPTAPINGVHYKLFVKDRGKKSGLPHVYERDIVIPGLNVEVYFKYVEEWLYDLVERAQGWRDWVDNLEHDPYEAGLNYFPQEGLLNGMCQRFGRLCDFASYCENHSLGGRTLRGFRPRTVKGEVYKEKETI